MRKKLSETIVNDHMFTSRMNAIDYSTFCRLCEKLGHDKSVIFRILIKKFNRGDIELARKEIE